MTLKTSQNAQDRKVYNPGNLKLAAQKHLIYITWKKKDKKMAQRKQNIWIILSLIQFLIISTTTILNLI